MFRITLSIFKYIYHIQHQTRWCHADLTLPYRVVLQVASGNNNGTEVGNICHTPPSLHFQSSQPHVIQIEVGFAQLPSHLSERYTVHNYDGSEMQTVVTHQCDGTETRSQLMLSVNGERQRRDTKVDQLELGKTGMLEIYLHYLNVFLLLSF